ncbi:MAG: hypothetical protein RI885_940 [Actinomycetota bacterium]
MNDTLEAGAGGAGFRGSLRTRPAAQTAVANFVRAHEARDPRTRLERMLGLGVLSDESASSLTEALAEMAVGEALEHVGSGWTVLHAVPLGPGSEIDHLVIGPGGVFTLSTRNYSDQSVWITRDVDTDVGRGTDHIRNSEFEIGRVERTLSAAVGSTVHALGVIVVVEPRSIPVTRTSRDVAVVPVSELASWLQAQESRLDPDEVARLARVAEQPHLWSAETERPPAPEVLFERFLEARFELDAAERVRRLWFAATATLLLASVALAAWGVMLVTATV